MHSPVSTALYIHCMNLCLVDNVKAVRYAGFFALLKSLYLCTCIKCHVMFIRQQRTRWACRANAVAIIIMFYCHTYQAVFDKAM